MELGKGKQLWACDSETSNLTLCSSSAELIMFSNSY